MCKKTINDKENLNSSLEDNKLSNEYQLQSIYKDGKIDKALIDERYKDQIEEIFGTSDINLIQEILSLGESGLVCRDEDHNVIDVLLRTLADLKPNNAREATLVVQAQALFSQGMSLLHWATKESIINKEEHYLKNAIKCLRLHNETMLTLERLRRGGEQKVVVQHVNVTDGGKAAIMAGNFKAEGGVRKKIMEDPLEKVRR
ncbi:MAG: hypothetical protein WB791_09045 [Waddliaceae bacterium]